MSRPVQELDVVPTRTLVAILAATVAITLGCLLWVWLVMRPFERADRGTATPLPAVRAEVGGADQTPVDQTLFSERTAFSARRIDQQRARLDSYGAVDGKPGTVHIPIARAMEILAKGGGQ